MLTRVPVGQVRFNLPGIYADSRGVASGKDLLLRFGTLDRLVGFLRLLSAERTPEELWSALRVLYARPTGGGREVFVRLGNPGGAVADLVATTARLAGGAPFTGSTRHFAPTRDSRAPLGFDAVSVAQDDGDFTLYGEDGAFSWRLEGELALERLLLRLQLRRYPGGEEAAFRAARGPIYIAARRGLAPALVDHLFASGVDAQVAICEPPRGSPFGQTPTFWLLRVPELPARLFGLASRTPGLTLYLPVLDDVLVAAGYEHPVRLASCRAALRGERLLLLAPPPGGAMEVAPRPSFSAIADVVKLRVPGGEEPGAAFTASVPSGALEVSLRLEPVGQGSGRAKAALVPWSQAPWLRRLLFALPAVALRNYRVAFVQAGVLVVAPERLEGIPFGQLLEEPLPGVLVPVGARLRPALSPELLADRLGVGNGQSALCVFPSFDAPPFRLAREAFEPLERRALARADLPWATGMSPMRAPLAPESPPPPEIENDPLGLMPLWGWRP